MTRKVILYNLFFFFFFFSFAGSSHADVTDAVVKIFVTSNAMDYYKPWQSKGTSAGGGSGCIIKGKKILTNAHVVTDHTFIQVKKNNDPKRYTARVEAIGHDCDLALLTVDDPAFFEGTEALTVGSLPKLQDTVTVLGYPQGGDKLSITEGVVSRTEITAYSQSARKLLTIQIDAAINPGNSGGPVVQNGKLVGIAMQVLQSGQNIGYMIPTPIIDHFFTDLEDSQYDGFPVIGIEYATTENVSMRQYYDIEDINGGVLVTTVLPFSPAKGNLLEGDVIVKIDGTAIAEDGTFLFRGNERIALPHLITDKQVNEDIRFSIIRAGKSKEIKFPMTSFAPLVPYAHQFENPPYYIFAGMVFTVLSTDLLKVWGGQWWEKAPLNFNYFLIGPGRLNVEQREEVVVLLEILADDVNVGYQSDDKSIIEQVNGQKFKSFKEFIQLLHEAQQKEEYIIFQTEGNAQLILRNENLNKITQHILQRYSIPAQYSADVAAWLENKE
ncbi:MAG: trypsin-like peptidase domain-containing protein [Candidatus Omnitrophica bacterium]|nr:trypsin-like peptidase domain-containing protein [Candidatus Omnitrophota bacterium]